MNRYSPLWSQVVDSSLWCEPDHVVKVFLTMIAKKDMDEIVRGSAFNISQWAKKTEEETLDALKILSSPDKKRLEPQPFEGRRIQKVPEGWLVLNGAYYRKMMGEAYRREYKRVKQAEYRKKGKLPQGTPSPGETSYLKAVKRGEEPDGATYLKEPPTQYLASGI